MKKYIFTVKGNNDDYTVTFTRNGDNLTITCNCPAGQNNMHCRHRIALLKGDFANIISSNKHETHAIKNLIKGTDIEEAFEQFSSAEMLYENAKKKLSIRKKELSQIMNN